ncbi:MAG: hypothetical protein GDA42_01385 [Ekhidna sp.]|nr:hypothetical protein [Ekhidna sp.]
MKINKKADRFLIILNLTIFCILNTAYAQVIPGTIDQRIDKLYDSTLLALYPTIKEARNSFGILDFVFRTSFNSTYSRGFNDGPVWKGKGLTTELHGGLYGSVGKLSFYVQPVVFFSQNLNFPLADLNSNFNSNSYQFAHIDWVQRYGEGAKIFFHPSQSEVSFNVKNFSAAISSQNYSFGPSNFNPILLSRQAAGFPHVRLGTALFAKKKFKLHFIAGLLKESNYFDDNTANNRRYINALFVGYSPLRNLKIGIGRILYKQTRYFKPEDFLSTIYVFEDNEREGLSLGNDTFDQLASISIDWNFPSVKFRCYAEFAKNDFTGGYLWTLIEPEHSRGYSIGFEKELEVNHKKIRLNYEHTNLSLNAAFLWRPTPPFYSHGVNRQGYTQNGQLIGAGIGPGGNSDHFFLGIEKDKTESLNFLIQRIENNRDYFVTKVQPTNQTQKSDLHDVEYSLSINWNKSMNKFLYIIELAASNNFNRYFIKDRVNFYLMVGLNLDI